MPARHHVTRQQQVGHAAGKYGVRAGLGVTRHKIHHIDKSLTGCGQALGYRDGIGAAVFCQLFFRGGNLGRQGFGSLAAIACGFTPHQVIGLDGGGAFINGQNFGVAVVLGASGFLNETHAAVHLHPEGRDLQAHLGAVALDQRHHEFIKRLVLLAHLGVCVVVCGVIGGSGYRGHGTATLHIRAHGHEHALHIGVVNDGATAWQ